MRLELPFESLLPARATVLIAGIGGGFDVFCGLPLYFELKRRGYTPQLASLSFAALKEYQESEWLSPTLVGVGAGASEISGYEAAVAYVHAQSGQQPSVINASVISAAQGHFGDYHATDRTRGSELWISPLMNLYWFFSVDAVAAQNLFLQPLQRTSSMGEVFGATYEARAGIELRPTTQIRLP